jgi:hypothetical protein
VPRSITKAEIPFFPLLRSVTAMATRMSPDLPCVMKIFDPFSTQASPSRTAVVRMAAASLPDPGSVRPHAASFSPVASGVRYWRRCSSLPNNEMWAAPRPLCAATESDTDGSTRASSSMQMQ